MEGNMNKCGKRILILLISVLVLVAGTAVVSFAGYDKSYDPTGAENLSYNGESQSLIGSGGNRTSGGVYVSLLHRDG